MNLKTLISEEELQKKNKRIRKSNNRRIQK